MRRPPTDPRQDVVPFGAHQAVEYLLGLNLVLNSAHLRGNAATALLVFGVALLGLAAVSDGMLGLGWVPRRWHRALDIVVIAALLSGPLVFHATAVAAVLLLESTGLCLMVLTRITSYRARAPRRSVVTPNPVMQLGARRLGELAGRARADGPRRLGQAWGRYQRRHRGPR